MLKLTVCKVIKLIAELCMYVLFAEVLHEIKQNKQTSILHWRLKSLRFQIKYYRSPTAAMVKANCQLM